MSVLELPTEILGNIFDNYVHDRSTVRQGQAPLKFLYISTYADSQTDPIDLTHVCRRWRTTAISIPRLWATMYTREPKYEGDVKMFELWLERSAGRYGTYPLDLTIKQSMSPMGMCARSNREFTQQIISLAIAQHRRWKHICLELRERLQLSLQPLYTAATPFSILRSFKLSLLGWSSDELRQLMGVLCSSPELQSITLGKESCRHTDIRVLLDMAPWDRPTTLNFATLIDSMFLRILSSSMDTLQHISVGQLKDSIVGSNSPTPSPILHATMRRLQSIHIRAIPVGDVGATFDKLTLPALRELRLPTGFGSRKPRTLTKRWNCPLNLLERSECKIQIFEFGGDSQYTEAFLTENLIVSPAFKHLTELRVTSGIGQQPDSLQLLDALSQVCEDAKPCLLPLLETLTLNSVHSVDHVQKMVSTRVAAYGGDGKSKLRRVSAQLKYGIFVLDMDLTSQSHL